MEKANFFIILGICLIELVVIFALLNKKKLMHVAILIAITFGIVGLIDTYQNRNLIFKIKRIDKTDYCPKCGKEVHIVSYESE